MNIDSAHLFLASPTISPGKPTDSSRRIATAIDVITLAFGITSLFTYTVQNLDNYGLLH